MAEWGAIVRVEHGGVGPTRQLLDDLMETLSDHAANAGCTERTVTVRLFVTAPDQLKAMEGARGVVLHALRVAGILHKPDTLHVLALDPMEEFERDFPSPE